MPRLFGLETLKAVFVNMVTTKVKIILQLQRLYRSLYLQHMLTIKSLVFIHA